MPNFKYRDAGDCATTPHPRLLAESDRGDAPYQAHIAIMRVVLRRLEISFAGEMRWHP